MSWSFRCGGFSSLYRCAFAVIVGAAVSFAPCPAFAFCRLTICDGTINSSTCTVKTPEACPPKRWRSMPIPVRFHKKLSTKLDADETRRALRSAMNRWSDVTCDGLRTSLRFQELPDAANDKPYTEPGNELKPGPGTEPYAVYFRDLGWDNQAPDKVDTIAVTHTFVGKTSGTIVNADIVVNASDHNFALDEDARDAAKFVGITRIDLEAVMTHEFGHYIGLAHSTEESSMMAAGLCSMPNRCLPDGQVRARRLALDDKAAVCELYPPSGYPALEPPDSGGCAVSHASTGWAAGASQLAMMLCALGSAAICLRRRAPTFQSSSRRR